MMKKIFFTAFSIFLALQMPWPAHAQGFSGHYDIKQGINPDGTTYNGHVVAKPRGDGVYNFKWTFPGTSGYWGVGLLINDILAVGWSDQPGYGVVVYNVDGGKLTGDWISNTTQEAFGYEKLEGPPGLNGVYDIVQAHGEDGGEDYSGTVEIRPNGEVYDVTWSIGYEVYTGVGLLRGKLFLVGWGATASSGIVYYEKTADGIAGLWAVKDNQNKGLEELVRINKKH